MFSIRSYKINEGKKKLKGSCPKICNALPLVRYGTKTIIKNDLIFQQAYVS